MFWSTSVKIKLSERIRARTSNVNDTFTAKTTEDVTINGVCYPAGSTVKGYINKYTINSSYKVNGKTMTTNYRTELMNNVNVNAVPSTVDVRYGVINEFSALRSFPTSDIATSSNDFDRWQETGLEVAQGCLIYHESLDGKWLFVQVFNYNGWVLKDKVTIVTKEQMLSFTRILFAKSSFVIIIRILFTFI